MEVFFDYTCPFCYVVHAYLEEYCPRLGVDVTWVPCEAHPRPEPRAEVKEPAPGWWRNLESAAKEAGITMRPPFHPVPHSDLAGQGMYAVAAAGGDLWEYHRRVYRAVFVEGLNIEEPEVLAGCADGLAISRTKFLEALEQDIYREAQRKANIYAYNELSIWAVPVLKYGNKRIDAVDGIGLSRSAVQNFLVEQQ